MRNAFSDSSRAHFFTDRFQAKSWNSHVEKYVSKVPFTERSFPRPCLLLQVGRWDNCIRSSPKSAGGQHLPMPPAQLLPSHWAERSASNLGRDVRWSIEVFCWRSCFCYMGDSIVFNGLKKDLHNFNLSPRLCLIGVLCGENGSISVQIQSTNDMD